MKADEVLKDHRDTRAQLCGIDTIDVNAIPRDGARSGPIEPCQEFRERGLTRTVLADQCHGPTTKSPMRQVCRKSRALPRLETHVYGCRNPRSRTFLTVCMGCNLCRPCERYVDVGFVLGDYARWM